MTPKYNIIHNELRTAVNENHPYFSLIIVAAGSGTRLSGDTPKQYMEICGKTVLRHTLDVFLGIPSLRDVCVVVNPAHEHLFEKATKGLENVTFCHGGSERKDSVNNGLKEFSNLNSKDIVLIHDAARPFVKREEISSLLETISQQHKAASLASPVVDTLRHADDMALAKENVSRDHLWAMQTPQAFHYGVIKQAHEKSDPNKSYTDDTALVSNLGIDVQLVKAGKQNFKITTMEDFHMAEHIKSSGLSTEMRTGMGYDVHAFDDEVADVTYIRLCGVDIEHDRKLKGHSDADVGLHALTDAILGAIGEGDIGLHFPPSNMDFKNMDSAVFLEHAMKQLCDKGGQLVNADVTLICERPKIGAYRDKIVERVADILDVSKARVNIKATTTEKLGFTGRKEGVAAQAVVSVSLPYQGGAHDDA